MQDMEEVVIIGISAGASVVLLVLAEFPSIVKKVVTVCGPVDIRKMNRAVL